MAESKMMHLKLEKDDQLIELIKRIQVLTGQPHFKARAIRTALEQYEPTLKDLQAQRDLVAHKSKELIALQKEFDEYKAETAKIKAAFTLLSEWAKADADN